MLELYFEPFFFQHPRGPRIALKNALCNVILYARVVNLACYVRWLFWVRVLYCAYGSPYQPGFLVSCREEIPPVKGTTLWRYFVETFDMICSFYSSIYEKPEPVAQ